MLFVIFHVCSCFLIFFSHINMKLLIFLFKTVQTQLRTKAKYLKSNNAKEFAFTNFLEGRETLLNFLVSRDLNKIL